MDQGGVSPLPEVFVLYSLLVRKGEERHPMKIVRFDTASPYAYAKVTRVPEKRYSFG